jgi:hypothetical protein
MVEMSELGLYIFSRAGSYKASSTGNTSAESGATPKGNRMYRVATLITAEVCFHNSIINVV